MKEGRRGQREGREPKIDKESPREAPRELTVIKLRMSVFQMRSSEVDRSGQKEVKFVTVFSELHERYI